MEASAKDLRFRSKEILDSIERGEEVIITYHGKPKAKIVPYKGKGKERKKTDIFGIWKDNSKTKDVNAFIDDIRGERFK